MSHKERIMYYSIILVLAAVRRLAANAGCSMGMQILYCALTVVACVIVGVIAMVAQAILEAHRESSR